MIGSRAVTLLRTVARTPKAKQFLQQVRKSSHGSDEPYGGWCYRTRNEPPKWAVRHATFTATVLWFWFYWNLWHGWPHIIGLYDGKFLPNPRNWTDEELGIPPDDDE